MTKQELLWKNVVGVRSRFQRSVHLERDAFDNTWLEGYVITPLVRALLGRVIGGLAAEATARSWSVTGPYGTGKSAYALFLSHLLGPVNADQTLIAHKLLKREDPGLVNALGDGTDSGALAGLVPVRISGERRPLEHLLLKGLVEAAEENWKSMRAPDVVGEVQQALEAYNATGHIDTSALVSLFERVADKVKRSKNGGRGLLVLLDEAGKAFEFAANAPSSTDLHVLQALAEAANRSGETPIVLIVFLHQAFEQYAGRLSVLQRNEWAKVQGRFADLPFQEAEDQLIRLIGLSIERHEWPKERSKVFKPVLQSAISSVARKSDAEAHQLEELAEKCLPLHPITAIALGPLFRSRLAQNERSLFAFLSGIEPGGFQEYLARTAFSQRGGDLFTLDRLYDYIQLAFGGRLYGQNAHLWAQVDTALRRLPADANDVEVRLVKTIGVLGAIADSTTLRASENVLRAALGSELTRGDLKAALDRLTSASIVIYRKFRDSFQLWEGSDLNLSELVNDALGKLSGRTELVTKLEKVAPMRPVVARRHLFETGTLRYFGVHYTDESIVNDGLVCASAEEDGALWMVVPSNDAAMRDLTAWLEQPMNWIGTSSETDRPVLVAVPTDTARLREVTFELAALEYVLTHTSKLQDDPIAMRELAGRIADAERTLRQAMAAVLDGRSPSAWYHRGKQVDVGAQGLSRLVSDICDKVYYATPILHNELINRRKVSTAAASARRTLMTAMGEHGTEMQLCIEGHPPEFAMYRSILLAHGLHSQATDGGPWSFAGPKERGTRTLGPVWDEIQKMLRETERRRVSVGEIYKRLKQPPFGLRDGVLPVLMLTAMLERRYEIEVYESSAFVPHLGAPEIERFIRQGADRFELQRFQVTGARAALFEKLAKVLPAANKDGRPNVIAVVGDLMRFYSKLNEFAQYTKNVSDSAAKVREALARAKEPSPLIYRDLPAACGLTSLSSEDERSGKDAAEFLSRLKTALIELQMSYPRLLDRVEHMLAESLSLPHDPDALRKEFSLRASRLLPMAGEAKLKGFLMRSSDTALDREKWIESIATILGGKPPKSWRDADIDQAGFALGSLQSRFEALEAILVSQGGEGSAPGTKLVRVLLSEAGAGDHEKVLTIRDADQPRMTDLCADLRQTLLRQGKDLSRDVMLAGLIEVARELMGENNSGLGAQKARPS